MKKVLMMVLAAALLAAPAAEATVLTFDTSNGFGSDYGNRVSNYTEGDYNYEDYGDWTPNVTVEYVTDAFSSFTIEGGYGNLDNALVMSSTDQNTEGYQIVLRADPGYLVSFYGLNAVTNGGVFTTSEIAVANTWDVVIGGEDIDVSNTASWLGGSYPILSREFTIRVGYYTPATGGFPVGIDDVTFGQVKRRGFERGQLKDGAVEESSWGEVKGLFR